MSHTDDLPLARLCAAKKARSLPASNPAKLGASLRAGDEARAYLQVKHQEEFEAYVSAFLGIQEAYWHGQHAHDAEGRCRS